MRHRRLLLSLSLVLLPGCATGNSLSTWLFGQPESYYTDPSSPGYTEAHYAGLCEVCGRVFYFSAAQWNSSPTATCPYDGHEQNLQQANNRYVYQVNQAQQQANAKLAQQAMATWNQQQTISAQKQEAFRRCMANCQMQQQLAGQGGMFGAGNPLQCFNVCQ